MSTGLLGFRRIATFIRNPLGYTSNWGTEMTAFSVWLSTALTANVEGSVPSEGRSQAGGAQRRSAGCRGGGSGSKKVTEQKVMRRSMGDVL
jgi:hypothetical protein